MTAAPSTGSPHCCPVLAAGAVRLGALWLAAGACFKLFLGTPNDLPAIVREVPLGIGLTYKLAITVELAVAFVALLKPRWGWAPLAAAFVVFDAILLGMLGEESCGCFGSRVTLSPGTMLAIDSVLLLAILVGRPWRLAPGPVRPSLLVAAVAVAAALPWILDREASGPGTVEAVEDGQARPIEGQYVVLDVERWVGRTLAETPLARFVPLDELIHDGLWVLYRNTCDHCAEHLRELATTEIGERMVTLVRLAEKHDTEANRVVDLMPEGGFVQELVLPDAYAWVLTTPGELVVRDGVIVSAREAAAD